MPQDIDEQWALLAIRELACKYFDRIKLNFCKTYINMTFDQASNGHFIIVRRTRVCLLRILSEVKALGPSLLFPSLYTFSLFRYAQGK